MAQVSLGAWGAKNIATVQQESGGSQPTAADGLATILISEGTGSGEGDVQFSSSTWDKIANLNNPREGFVVTQEDETTTIPYTIEELDTNNRTAAITVHRQFDRDNTEGLVIGAGTGDGTDYSADGVGDNPFGAGNLTSDLAYLFSDGLSVKNYSPNSTSGTNNNMTSVDSLVGDAAKGDGSDDYIDTNLQLQFSDGVFVFFLNMDTLPTGDPHRIWSQDEHDDNGNDVGLPSININHGEFAPSQGSINILQYDDDTGDLYSMFTDDTLSANTDYIIVIEVGNGEPNVWVNGNGPKSMSSASAGVAPSSDDFINSAGGTSKVATNTDAGNSFLNGNVDQLVVNESTDFDVSAFMGIVTDSHPIGGQSLFSWSGEQQISQEISSTFDAALKSEDTEISATYDTSIALTNQETNLGIDAIVSETGTLSGTVTLEQNAVQGAEVICYNSTDQEFVGQTITDSNTSGNYSFSGLDTEKRYFVATRYFDSNNNTRYAEAATVILKP